MYNTEITPITHNELSGTAVSITDRAEAVLSTDAENEPAVMPHHDNRMKQCEVLGDLEVAQFIRNILARDMERFSRLAAASSDIRDVQSMCTA